MAYSSPSSFDCQYVEFVSLYIQFLMFMFSHSIFTFGFPGSEENYRSVCVLGGGGGSKVLSASVCAIYNYCTSLYM